MTVVRHTFDLIIDLLTAALWGLAAYFLAARLLSDEIGLGLGVAVFVTMLTMILTGRHQEHRARSIAAGQCPRCSQRLSTNHDHRRWDTGHAEWLDPHTTWQCASCTFQYTAPLPCQTCPAAV